MDMLTGQHLPQWLQALLSEKFYNACIFHEEARRNEKSMFCLDCCESICPHCLNSHASHRLLRIRRYVYHDVIRLSDAEKLMDCAFVQAYICNSAKVVFLNQRPLTRPCRGLAKNCSTCDRTVQHPYLFCSLSCKLQFLLRNEGSVFKYIYKRENITLPEPPRSDDDQMTPDSILEQTAESASSESGGGAMASLRAFACSATTEIVRKKRSPFPTFRRFFPPATEMTAAMMNRRKGNRPQRSPLY